jgi:hypothetical protein
VSEEGVDVFVVEAVSSIAVLDQGLVVVQLALDL